MNIKKVFIILFCMAFIIISIGNSILSMDSFHIECCNNENCSLCKLITIAMDFVKNIKIININIFYFVLLIPLLRAISNYTIKPLKKLTLVDLKVVQIN